MNAIAKLYKLFLWPLCRTYARYVVKDRTADIFLRFLCKLQFWSVHQYWPNFVSPQKFYEKLWNRMLFERGSQFTMISDKYRVREYVTRKIGSEYLVPLIWSGNNPEEIPFDKLPRKFVIKTNHGCGYNTIVEDKAQLDQTEIKIRIQKWLKTNFCQSTYLGIAWGYKNIIPTIIIESFIEERGKVPIDYKFYCFSGKLEILTLHFGRFEEHKTIAFNRNFEPHEFRYHHHHRQSECQRPQNFETMVHLAESLSAEFDFMRVDLYNIEGQIYFGEFTPYPGGVSKLIGFDASSYDYSLGKKWN